MHDNSYQVLFLQNTIYYNANLKADLNLYTNFTRIFTFIEFRNLEIIEFNLKGIL